MDQDDDFEEMEDGYGDLEELFDVLLKAGDRTDRAARSRPGGGAAGSP